MDWTGCSAKRTYEGCHGAVRNCWGEDNHDSGLGAVGDGDVLRIDHSQLFERQRMFRIRNAPNQI